MSSQDIFSLNEGISDDSLVIVSWDSCWEWVKRVCLEWSECVWNVWFPCFSVWTVALAGHLCTDTAAHPDTGLSVSLLLGGFSWSHGCEESRCTTSFSSPSSSDSSPTSSTSVLSVLLVATMILNSLNAGTRPLFWSSRCQCVYPRYPKTGNDYPVGFTRNILNICHQSLRCK